MKKFGARMPPRPGRSAAARSASERVGHPSVSIADQNAMVTTCSHSRRPGADPDLCSACREARGERFPIQRVKPRRIMPVEPIDDQGVN